MNQRDLIHKWAHGLNDATSSGAVYVSGGTLVSYGLHFPLGIRCGEKFGKPRFLLNSRDSSATTSKHKSWTRGATGHGECLFVPLFDAPGSYSFLQTAERMMKDFMFAAKQTESNGPRKREEASATCAQLVAAAKALPEFVAGIRTGAGAKVVLSKPTKAILRKLAGMDISAAAEAVRRQERREELSKKRALAARMKAEAEALAVWKAGGVSTNYFATLALRLSSDGKTVETSQGATVTTAAARHLWKHWGLPELVGQSIDGYRVNESSAQIMRIGCHTIDRKTAAEFAKAQGW